MRPFRRQRGQSLIVAVIVMFVLLFIGGIFVALVARNLMNTGRARETLTAYQLAESGAQYAAYMLENSADGADWRPAPVKPADIDPRDPDRRWLLDGFNRVEFRGGRFLIRVSMAMRPEDPLGRYIKIETVGRPGLLNPNDPTSFLNVPAPRLRREIVAYKAIGITDYLRFVTNKDNDSKAVAYLGMPPISVMIDRAATNLPANAPLTQLLAMQFGGVPFRGQNAAGTMPPPGAAIRANSDLVWMGNRPGDTILEANRGTNDMILSSGRMQVDPASRPVFTAIGEAGNTGPLYSSDDANYTTYQGLVRDGGPNPDRFGYARGISRLDPPLLDAIDQATNVTRYRVLTRDSGIWVGPAGNQFNTGRWGFGAGVWVNNLPDLYRDTNVPGGTSPRQRWLHLNRADPDWHGAYYLPKGVLLDFGYQIVPNDAGTGFDYLPGFRLTRTDPNGFFRDPTGATQGLRELVFTFFIYKPANRPPVIKIDNWMFRAYIRNTLGIADVDKYLPAFDGAIFAEGNIRVRGLVPSVVKRDPASGQLVANMPIRLDSATDQDARGTDDILMRVAPPSVTVVSGGDIYIDGSLVREDLGPIPGTATERAKYKVPNIALMAQDNVVVNTTVFMRPNQAMNAEDEFGASDPRQFYRITTAQSPAFWLDFAFGDRPDSDAATGYLGYQGAMPPTLFIRHGADANSTTYMDMPVNNGAALPPGASALYQFNVVPGHPEAYTMSAPQNSTQAWFQDDQFTLLPPPNGGTYLFNTAAGAPNLLQYNVDTEAAAAVGYTGTTDYLFERAAVVPMDVRIEALLYAENGSFFIIPGQPLNQDPADTPDQDVDPNNAGQILRPDTVKTDAFPYYMQPIDCRITIVGAIAESRTASVSDQGAWMQLWGYIPEVYGSTGRTVRTPAEVTVPQQHINVAEVGPAVTGDIRQQFEKDARITRGLRFIYDPSLAAPYAGYDPNGGVVAPQGSGNWLHVDGGAFRQDDYGRALPPCPRMPVCPGFVFYGEVS